ncbi:MAG: hypothetical protein R2800_03730 [Flavipsychrobacter sp.]
MGKQGNDDTMTVITNYIANSELYTLTFLVGMGMIGIILHNLVKLDGINRKAKGEINLLNYWKLERFSIAISILVIVGATLTSHEISQLDFAGKWLGLGYISLGYTAQSMLAKFTKRAENYIK